MERNEISVHEVRFFNAIRKAGKRWATSKELAKEATVAERTGRAICLKLVRLGLLDLAEVFPAHRYRLSEFAKKRNAAYLGRIAKAAEAFGLAD